MTSPGVREGSMALALELGQVRRIGPRAFVVASRTRPGITHTVAWALDGEFICNCEAASLGQRECWAIRFIREELAMKEIETERALVPVRLQPPTTLLPGERTYTLIERAAALALSGAVALPKELNTRDKVAAVMLWGWELGLRPMTAIQHLYIVNGRVQPSAQVMAGLLAARTDARIQVVESTDKKCTLRLIWPSRQIDESWTVEWLEIERAKLASKEVWQSYPREKLVAHCTKRLLRIYAPDIINGLIGPVIDGVAPEEDEIDPAELYNNGDDERIIDHETGEIIEPRAEQQPPATAKEDVKSPASPTDDARAQLRSLWLDINQTWDAESKSKLIEEMKGHWPAVFEAGGVNNLSYTQARDAVAFLRRKSGGTPETEPEVQTPSLPL